MNETKDWQLIHTYTRRQAIADGVLVDVTERAKEAGFRVPVALTSTAWAECVTVPEGLGDQDETGRLWDVLWMCRAYASRNGSDPEILFHVLVKKKPGKPKPKKAVREKAKSKTAKKKSAAKRKPARKPAKKPARKSSRRR